MRANIKPSSRPELCWCASSSSTSSFLQFRASVRFFPCSHLNILAQNTSRLLLSFSHLLQPPPPHTTTHTTSSSHGEFCLPHLPISPYAWPMKPPALVRIGASFADYGKPTGYRSRYLYFQARNRTKPPPFSRNHLVSLLGREMFPTRKMTKTKKMLTATTHTDGQICQARSEGRHHGRVRVDRRRQRGPIKIKGECQPDFRLPFFLLPPPPQCPHAQRLPSPRLVPPANAPHDKKVWVLG